MIKDLYDGADAWLHDVKGLWRRARCDHAGLLEQARQIVMASEVLQVLNQIEFDELVQSATLQAREQRNDLSEVKLIDVLAVIVEASARALGKRPYDVQVMSVLAMEQAYAIEMGTGEGKTLVAAVGTVLLAWKGQHCHVVTSNDYLAARDAKSLQDFYSLCGLSVAYLSDEMEEEERRSNYLADVLYSTSNNLLADYLKDRLMVDYDFGSSQERIRKLDYQRDTYLPITRPLEVVIVDEADSVLADDAITPLIISTQEPDQELHEATGAAYHLAKLLVEGIDFTVHLAQRQVRLTDTGYEAMEAYQTNFPPSWSVQYRYAYVVVQALSASYLHQNNKEYVISEDKIVIVDEKTGRLMPSRTWSNGLHQAVEMKEGLALSHPTRISAKMSFQSYFRMYRSITGMSGTLHKIEKELWRIYHLPVVKVPTRVAKRHQHLKERIFATKAAKVKALLESASEISTSGRPVLVGTRSIQESQYYYEALSKLGIRATVLNALEHEQEADIIAEAGGAGKITIATNMAGRGTDIVISDVVDALGGLHVIATARNSSRRIDRQLYGRASRQGQAGSSESLLSLEDEMLQVFLPGWLMRFYKKRISSRWVQQLAIQSYILVQLITEWRASKTRIDILLQDIKSQKLMSFAQK